MGNIKVFQKIKLKGFYPHVLMAFYLKSVTYHAFNVFSILDQIKMSLCVHCDVCTTNVNKINYKKYFLFYNMFKYFKH